jgi:hypothetical protein
MSAIQSLLWLCVACYGIHILEEFVLDWRNWAWNVLHLPAEWNDFYITNALVIVLGIVAAEIAPIHPVVALGFPCLMLINALFFHVAPFLWTRGRFSPGLITALLLFFPMGSATLIWAHVAPGELVCAFGSGFALMALPILFLKMRSMPYFDQAR